MDKDNDLFIGLNDMEITDYLNISFFKEKADFINSYDVIIIDSNLKQDALEYLLKAYKGKQIIMDAVSAEKVIKLKGLLKYITLLKLNVKELKALSDKATVDLQIDDLLSQGLLKILVTNSGNEIIFKSKNECIKSMPLEAATIINSSGAGDAFLGGFIHGIINDKSLAHCLEIAKKTAFLTLQSSTSTNRNITLSEVK
jgi:pseudouridine kinase